LVLNSGQPHTQTITGYVELSADTVYVLEFEYWSYNFTGMFYAGLIPDDYRMWLTPTPTVQRARFEIDSNDLRWLNSRLRFVTYGQSGRVYVANVRFYNRDAVESARPPQGSTRPGADLDNNPFRFAGMYWDGHAQTYMTPNRMMNPRTGRWTQPDPHWTIHNSIFGDSPTLRNNRYMPSVHAILQSGNLYMFTMHDSVNFVDPTGLFAVAPGALLGGAALAAAATAALAAAALLVDHAVRGNDSVVGQAADAIGRIVTPAPLITTVSIPQTSTRDDVTVIPRTGPAPPRGTIIYRGGSGNATNMTPRITDVGGLSFYLLPPETGSFTMTTIEAVNATGVLRAIVDGPNHVSVIPADPLAMPGWIASRYDGSAQHHPLTLIMMAITIRVR